MFGQFIVLIPVNDQPFAVDVNSIDRLEYENPEQTTIIFDDANPFGDVLVTGKLVDLVEEINKLRKNDPQVIYRTAPSLN